MNEEQKQVAPTLVGSIIGVAASLAIAMPLLAVGAAFAVRIFCYLSGLCL